MNWTEPNVFYTTLEKSQRWITETMDELGWQDRQRGYLALRGTLQTLRDRLTVEEATQLGAQLPMLVRGFYYEAWSPKGKPRKLSREQFLEQVHLTVPFGVTVDPEQIVRAVFNVLSRRISEGEIEDVKQLLPKDLEELWP